jgi:HEPN domain-containing protein
MKPHIEEALLSLRLADRDIKALEVLSNDPEVHLSVACLHAQQAVEKSLKAALFAHEIELGRTHDLLSYGQRGLRFFQGL